MMNPENAVARNTWLATEAAALTTLQIGTLLDSVTIEPIEYQPTDIEDLNGLTYSEADAKGYPQSLLIVNAIGMNLAVQLSDNSILEDLLDEAQAKRFNRFTYMGYPHEVQKEYIGTYFSFTTRLLRGYVNLLYAEGDSNLTTSDLADLMKTDFIKDRIAEALATASLFWGIAPMESLVDMEEKEAELKATIGVNGLYQLTSEREGRWKTMTYRPEVLEAAKSFLNGNNADAGCQRSSGCPMRFKKMSISSASGGDNFLSPVQKSALVAGGRPVGRIEGETLALLRNPLDELTDLFAESIRSSDMQS